jgi:hypothetical protein
MTDKLGRQLAAEAATLREYAEQIMADVGVPTVDDVPIDEYPLEIIDERGRQFAVVLSTGGPHIEIVADGSRKATLAGYWWGESHELYDDAFDILLNYFIDRTVDQ